MTIRIVARCAEKDRGGLERSLKREMRLLLTRHNIAPYQLQFPHEVDETPSIEEDTEELKSADEFVEEQKESAKDLGNEAKEE